MASFIFQSYLLCVSCIVLVLVSGFASSLEHPTAEHICILDAPGNQFCCIEACNPNCNTDCFKAGFPKGGHCYAPTGTQYCCCFK